MKEVARLLICRSSASLNLRSNEKVFFLKGFSHRKYYVYSSIRFQNHIQCFKGQKTLSI
jgi:hypothetical protein